MGAVKFQPITEEQYWYCLEVLPPALMAGGGHFLVGEPMDHRPCQITGNVLPRYTACFILSPEVFAEADRPLTIPEFKALTKGGNFLRSEILTT